MKTARLITVDIGNSTTKLGWFDESAIGKRIQPGDPAMLPQPLLVCDFPTGQSPPDPWLAQLPTEPVRWRVASVQREGQRVLARWVLAHRPQDDFHVLCCRDLPIDIQVDFPERVGLDRLAAAVAANVVRQPNRPAIVVDAGTAVTIDVVSSQGIFEGGVILAGYRMQAEALFGTADLLPLATLAPEAEPPPPLGKNTEAAIRSGLFWGTVGAVREIVAQLSAGLGSRPDVLVTGGDLRRLAGQLGQGATFVPHMVLAGIAWSESRTQSPPGKEAGALLT